MVTYLREWLSTPSLIQNTAAQAEAMLLGQQQLGGQLRIGSGFEMATAAAAVAKGNIKVAKADWL